jgi:hypothetical protein
MIDVRDDALFPAIEARLPNQIGIVLRSRDVTGIGAYPGTDAVDVVLRHELIFVQEQMERVAATVKSNRSLTVPSLF